MLLKDYKVKNKKTLAEVGDPFGLEPYQVHRLIARGAEITGKKGARVIKIVEVVVREAK
jgi:hypothetical protein